MPWSPVEHLIHHSYLIHVRSTYRRISLAILWQEAQEDQPYLTPTRTQCSLRSLPASAGQVRRRKTSVSSDLTLSLLISSCSSCTRSYQFLARTQPNPARDSQGVQCFYDEDEHDETPQLGKRKAEDDSTDPRLTVHQLEARVGACLTEGGI
jgi:hypothetical protein